jgi:predicted house-cleaning noncanonical NTP pyrophosphatase (MazG superfamily)
MNLERIASLLSQNLKPSQVASIVGCSPARITQISQQEDFKLLLANKQAEEQETFTEAKALDAKYLVAEHKLIDAITAQADFSEMRDNISALRALTERQFRKQALTNPVTNGSVSLTQNIVHLHVPTHTLPEISVNSMNEVVAINNSTLAPLSSQGVTSLFASMKERNQQNEQQRLYGSANQNDLSFIQEGQAADCIEASLAQRGMANDHSPLPSATYGEASYQQQPAQQELYFG